MNSILAQAYVMTKTI